MATIQINRTKTGVVPVSLADGELYIDQLNGKMYWTDATGVVRNTALLVTTITAAQMPALTGDVTSLMGTVATTIAAGAVTFAKLAAAAVATTAQFLANTASKLLTTDQVWAAASFVALPDAVTIAMDMSTFINASVTLAGNRTLGHPYNVKAGQAGSILVKQDGYGSRTLTFHSYWKFAGGTVPSLSTSAGAVDRLDYLVVDSTHIHASLTRAVA